MDAIQVYCTKPGCSCLDCDTPDKSANPQHWPGVKDTPFTSLGHHVRITASDIYLVGGGGVGGYSPCVHWWSCSLTHPP